MNILAIHTGPWGERIARNLRDHAPSHWQIAEFRAPAHYPIVIDDPRDFLPQRFDAADLVLALGEASGAAELIPDVCRMTGARSMIAPIDNSAWLPKGLANQLRDWLTYIGVVSVFPKPFCSLTETTYSLRGQRVEYDDWLISEFARGFGKPRFRVEANDGKITQVEVERAAPCGCADFVAQGLQNVEVNDAEFQAGMLHHHYPCWASMGIDPDYSDTLMHVSGNLTVDAISAATKAYRAQLYIKPQ
ncbi:MAG: hypothetical protein HY327_06775 [Chloroflexi bacterium]|nr:hypothetical protein [Chloroflexota bacterium]